MTIRSHPANENYRKNFDSTFEPHNTPTFVSEGVRRYCQRSGGMVMQTVGKCCPVCGDASGHNARQRRLPFNLLVMLLVTLCLFVVGCDKITFMKVCEYKGTFYYPEGYDTDAKCPVATAMIKWPKMPLVTCISLSGDYRDSAKEAMEFWNGWVGERYFVEDDVEDACVVMISAGSTGKASASSWHRRISTGQLIAVVEINNPGDVMQTKYMIAHELGHVLGLAHDTSGGSIMETGVQFPSLMGDWAKERRPSVTCTDKKALNSVYYK